MAITLSDGTTTIELNKDLYWSDESDYSPVKQAVDPTLTGGIVVQAALMTAGQPITLQPDGDDTWTTRDVLDQLRNWAAVPMQELTLTLRGVTHQVLFRHQDGGLVSTPVRHTDDVDPTDQYLCTIRLMEI